MKWTLLLLTALLASAAPYEFTESDKAADRFKRYLFERTGVVVVPCTMGMYEPFVANPMDPVDLTEMASLLELATCGRYDGDPWELIRAFDEAAHADTAPAEVFHATPWELLDKGAAPLLHKMYFMDGDAPWVTLLVDPETGNVLP